MSNEANRHPIAQLVLDRLAPDPANKPSLSEQAVAELTAMLATYFGRQELVGACAALLSVANWLLVNNGDAAALSVFSVVHTAEAELETISAKLSQRLNANQLAATERAGRDVSGQTKIQDAIQTGLSAPKKGGLGLRRN